MSGRWVKMTDRGPWHRMGDPVGQRVRILCREAPVDYVSRLSGGFPPDGDPMCDRCITAADDNPTNT